MPNGVSILYGPFPLRVGRLLGALAALALAILLCAVALETQTLRCDFGARGTCFIESKFSPKADTRFAGSEFNGAKVESVYRGKGRGTEYGVVVLTASNREHRLMDTEPARARAIAENITAAAASRTTFELTLSGPRWLLAFAALCAAMGISMSWLALRRAGKLVLSPLHDGSLRVERRVLGIPVRASSLSLHGVTDVVLEWKEEADFWRARHEQPRQVGRIRFVTRERSMPMTDEFWPGRTLHYGAAAELRQHLGFSPGALEAELTTLENTLERPLMAQSASQRFGLGWAGACVGSLAGLALLGVIGLAFGFVRCKTASSRGCSSSARAAAPSPASSSRAISLALDLRAEPLRAAPQAISVSATLQQGQGSARRRSALGCSRR